MFYSDKLSAKIVNLATQTNDDVKKNAEVYTYLINYIFEQIIFFSVLLIFGFFTHNVLFSILFFLIFFTYRSTGGGYHASNPALCTIISYLSFIATYIFCYKITVHKSLTTLILYILAVVFMLICPFSDCKNRIRSTQQKKELKIKQLIFIILFSTVGFILYFANYILYFKLIMISTFIIALTQAIGVIQMRIDNGGSYDI